MSATSPSSMNLPMIPQPPQKMSPSPTQCHCPPGSPPFPPAKLLIRRDVAIIFHAHCLSPFRFYADMNRNNRTIWSKQIAFPLERLFALIQNGIWSDVESEQIWSRGETLPYQLWETDPVVTQATLRLQPVEMACAFCSQMEHFLIEEFTEMHVTKVNEIECPSCRKKFNADRLSAKYFKDDLASFMKLHRPWSPAPHF